MKRQIIPGILTGSVEDLRKKVSVAGDFAKRLSIDVIDGIFADNLTVMPNDMREIDWMEMKVDIQLMVEEPIDHLGELHLLKVSRAIGHVEKMGKPGEYVYECKELGLGVGWGFDLYTPLSAIEKDMLMEAEVVLLMSVQAGFSGQEFDGRVVEKISDLRQLGFEGDVVIDGGLNKDTIPACIRAGANQFSVTSAIWDNDEPRLGYEALVGIL